jgi:hypothetical protein
MSEAPLPPWWSAGIAAAWARVHDTAVTDWHARGDRFPMQASIIEQALAFGHGARSAYPHLVTWEAVGPQLHLDWTRLGNINAASWDTVAHIVRHEWLRAAGPGGDAAPSLPEPAPTRRLQ